MSEVNSTCISEVGLESIYPCHCVPMSLCTYVTHMSTDVTHNCITIGIIAIISIIAIIAIIGMTTQECLPMSPTTA